MKTVEEVVELTKKLPERLQEEVRDFARFLGEKRARPTRKKLRLDWARGLKDLRDEYTSVELQHKSLDWWVEAALVGCSNADAIHRGLQDVSPGRTVTQDTGQDTGSRPSKSSKSIGT